MDNSNYNYKASFDTRRMISSDRKMNEQFVNQSVLLLTRRVSKHVDSGALWFTKVWFTSLYPFCPESSLLIVCHVFADACSTNSIETRKVKTYLVSLFQFIMQVCRDE